MKRRVLCAVVMMVMVGCGAKVDTSDPKAVAEACVSALARGDLEGAVQYVIPEEQEMARKELMKAIPPLPEKPELKVTVQGERADAEVLNAKNFGMDMKLKDGRWWIVK
jgi:hypothetical protein